VFVADSGNNRVMVFPSLVFASLVGTPAQYALGGANVGGFATPSSLVTPVGLFADRKNTLYVGDTGNNRVVHYLYGALRLLSGGAPVELVNNGAGFFLLNTAPVAPGSLATLETHALLSQNQNLAQSIPISTTLAGFQLVVNDALAAPLTYIGPAGNNPNFGQVNFQVPGATPAGSNRVAVRTSDTGELIVGGAFSVGTVGPGLFTQKADGTGQAWIVNLDGTINDASHAAARGSVISLYGTGQGPVDQPVPDGYPPSGLTRTITVPGSDAQSCAARNAICVLIGTTTYGIVQFSGLSPQFPGEWQINVQIPSNAPTGNAVPVKVNINSVPSNTVNMAIK